MRVDAKRQSLESLCRLCGEEANTHDCKNKIKCANCGGEHVATSRTCPLWKREKKIVIIKYRETSRFLKQENCRK